MATAPKTPKTPPVAGTEPQASRAYPLTRRDLHTRFGLPPERFLQMADAGLFPKPLQIGPKTHRWNRADVDAWQAEQERLSGINATAETALQASKGAK